MRVSSSFHDYYDGCMAYGQDTNVVYVREHKTFDPRAANIPRVIKELAVVFEDITHRLGDSMYRWRWQTRLPTPLFGRKCRIELYNAHILFCGVHYPTVQCTVSSVNSPLIEIWCYTTEQVIDILEKHGVEDNTSKGHRHSVYERIRDWFVAPKQPSREWMVANKVTCAVYDAYGTIHINPPLREYQFYRCMDSYTTYQELDMWISGTLAYPHNMPIEIDDKYRIIAHGFDEKYGFRKRPQHDKKTI